MTSWTFIFFLYLFILSHRKPALSTNTDGSSLERLMQTKRPFDLVRGRLRVSDRQLRKFSLNTRGERSPTSSPVCKTLCIISGATIEFKWLSCFDSLIIQMKGLAEKKDSVPNSCLWIILFLHFLPVSYLWVIFVWKSIIIEFHVTKSLYNRGKISCIMAFTRMKYFLRLQERSKGVNGQRHTV